MAFLRSPRPALRPVALSGLAALLVAGIVTAVDVSPAGASTYPVPSSGSFTVTGLGNGHGHGLSQYGARGAAMAGLSASAIVSFYYPHTTLKTLHSTVKMRVLISGAPTYPTIAVRAGLSVRSSSGAAIKGVANPLPTAGLSRYRLAPSGVGLKLQRLKGSTWATVPGASALPARVDFLSATNLVRLYYTGGTSTVYHGTLGGVRSGSKVLTINRAKIDEYVEGVVPREMPASWRASAVQAQAIAARSYGEYERAHAGTRVYDICDSSQCQVYGGKAHYSAGGTLLWSDDPAALHLNSRKVLAYQGTTIFAQFSASNGGWTADGGQPYLVAKADRYDNAASGDPYLNWRRSVSAASIARYYGLARVTKLEITKRDGHGAWGGRVLLGYVNGVSSAGRTQRIAVTGVGLQSAMGLPHNWFTIA
jgi:peptidoglycan hydrolase-like amidase